MCIRSNRSPMRRRWSKRGGSAAGSSKATIWGNPAEATIEATRNWIVLRSCRIGSPRGRPRPPRGTAGWLTLEETAPFHLNVRRWSRCGRPPSGTPPPNRKRGPDGRRGRPKTRPHPGCTISPAISVQLETAIDTGPTHTPGERRPRLGCPTLRGTRSISSSPSGARRRRLEGRVRRQGLFPGGGGWRSCL